jgi:PAS domain S-box-containing protein
MDYAWAFVAVLLAIVARWFADPRLGTHQLPYGSVLVATIFVSWFVGLRPALVVVAVGGVAANFFLQTPRWSFEPGPDKQSWGLVVFMFLGSVISLAGGYVHAQRARAEGAAATLRVAETALRQAHDELERRVHERTAELARTNDSLRVSEERFRILVEGIRGYAILLLDGAGQIVAWNGGAERLFGRGADIVGGCITTLVPGLDVTTLLEVASRGTTEQLALRNNVTLFPIELEITRLVGTGGASQPDLPLGGIVAIVHDISERKRLEALTEHKQRRAEELRRKTEELEADNRRMQEAARLQSEFLANMSHELRTPLNAIIGFAELLHRGDVGPINDQQREFLGDVLASSRHLLQMICDVLDFSTAESGTLQVVPEPVELARMLGEVRDLVPVLASGRNVAVDVAPTGNLGRVTVDPQKLRQILYHYVSNALKFTPEGGRVTIRAALAGAAFRIEVEDTGIGIANEDQRHLFVAFRPLDASATKRYQGTGLGLALCKRLAEAHGGTVGVRSARGVGSTFWVELPREPFPPVMAVARTATR